VDSLGIRPRFGGINSITLKLVPIREAADSVEYSIHQLSFRVADVEAILRLAQEHGGQTHGEIVRDGAGFLAAVRDPDGSTIELYSSP
jgi:predicted enzyme related to lactoylglutathione lyase